MFESVVYFDCINMSICLYYTQIYCLIHFQYGHLHNITVGNHEYEKNGSLYTPLSVCQEFYRNGTIFPGNDTFEIDTKVETGVYAQATHSRIRKQV